MYFTINISVLHLEPFSIIDHAQVEQRVGREQDKQRREAQRELRAHGPLERIPPIVCVPALVEHLQDLEVVELE